MASLNRERILALLHELDIECAARGIVADVFLVGGAAMALAYDADRSTRDLDGVFAPKKELREAIATVAVRQELEPDWFNDAAKGFLPGNDDHASVQFETPNIRVEVASPRYMLAMKLLSARPEYDLEDAVQLTHLCGISSEDELNTLITSYYPENQIQVKSRYFIGDVIQTLQEGNSIQSRRLTTDVIPGSSLPHTFNDLDNPPQAGYFPPPPSSSIGF